ncbi:MAG: hypothetical protein E7249_20730 [Paenibacillaceae bacterium]|nr:hypothetical protein [Paenibacillaceae bacterium]
MVVHQVFAQIFEEEIKNIIVCDNYEMANWLSRAAYGDKAFSVDCLQYPCQAGDRYRDGVFYRVGENGAETVIDLVMSTDQEMESLRATVNTLILSGLEG